MILLAIDTAASLCAACVYDDGAGRELGRSVLDIGKGHAERLMGTVAEALAAAGLVYADLDRIGVSVGPGSFTGVRVGVATARGLALALKIPAAGVSTLEAIAAEARALFPGRAVLAAIDGRRGDLYCAVHAPGGELLSAPAAISVERAVELATAHDAMVTGTAADTVLALLGESKLDSGLRPATADIATYARLAAARSLSESKPAPLYLRGADAKPQSGFALSRTGK